MKTHVFRSARYRIVESDRIKRDGYCDWRRKKGKKLWIKKSLSDEKRLDVLIHEGLHACLPDADEHTVQETAQDLALFLLRDGWRRSQ
jgi:uncharacterized protein YfaQ (DUF2300 family)